MCYTHISVVKVICQKMITKSVASPACKNGGLVKIYSKYHMKRAKTFIYLFFQINHDENLSYECAGSTYATIRFIKEQKLA